MRAKSFEEVIGQVPVDYYEKGVKTNYFQKFWHESKWKALRKLLKDVDNGTLLDIGCADGTTTHQIKKFLPKTKITGLDYYRGGIAHARKTKPNIKFVIGDAHKLPFADKSFDVVTIIETLEHLKNPKAVLSEIHRVLKKNGIIIMGQDTDSMLFKLVWFLWTKSKGGVWQGSHINCMEPKALLSLVKKSRFEIQKVEYINLGMEVFIKSQKI